MKKDDYLSISDFAKRAGVNRSYIYKLLPTKLKPYCLQVDNKQMLKIQALELFNVSKVDTEETDGDTLKELIEILQEQQETLKAELSIKNQQIESQCNQLEEYSERLKESHFLIAQQQKNEQKLLETTATPQEIPKQESLLNRDKFSTEAEYQQYLLKLLPRIGMFSNRYDLQELNKVLEMMSEYERKLIFRDKRAKEAIEHIKGVDFDQLEKDLAEAEKESAEMRNKWNESMEQMRAEQERKRAEQEARNLD